MTVWEDSWSCAQKARYATKARAEASRVNYMRQYGYALKVYRCPDCRAYHYTTLRAPDGRRIPFMEATA